MFFFIFIGVVIIQRLTELVVAKKNEKWMRSQGAKEYGKKHYGFMVAIHAGFFVSLLAEVMILNRSLSPLWPLLLSLFLITQAARVWIISSMEKYWNTKIIVLPGAQTVKKGPFRFIRHPNYLIVTIELLVIPLLFNAYWTAAVFFILNQAILAVRIPAEERALKSLTDYQS